MIALLRGFVRLNIAASKTLEGLFPQARLRLEETFFESLSQTIEGNDRVTLLDVGGGRSSAIAKHVAPHNGVRVVAVDISREELALNRDVCLKVCADASRGLPFADNTAELVASRFLIEHLPDTATFIEETARVLTPGGAAFHLLAAKYSPFALLGRLLPEKLSRRMVRIIYPAQAGILGYKVFYDRCSVRAVTDLLRKQGFAIRNIRLSYHQSAYAYACLPLFLLSACYDLLVYTLNMQTLCAAIFVHVHLCTAPEIEHEPVIPSKYPAKEKRLSLFR